MKKGTCFSCFEDMAFQYFGHTDTFGTELRRYVEGINEGEKLKCETCDRIIYYEKEGSKWREKEGKGE